MSPPTAAEQGTARALIALSAIFTLVSTNSLLAMVGIHQTHQIADGSLIRQLQFGSLFMVAAGLAWRHRRAAWDRLVHANPFLLALLALSLASTAWSAAPDISFKRIILVFGLVLIGVTAAPPLVDTRRMMRLLLGTLFALTAISALVAVALPGIGQDQALGGAWQGILWHKNILGSICAFSVVLWLWAMANGQARARYAIPGLLFSAFVLVMAKSSTALLVAAAGSATYLLFRRRYWSNPHVLPATALLLLIVALAGLHFFYVFAGRLPHWQEFAAPVTGLFNKGTDLTGRSEIWDLVMLSVHQRPWLGIGYGAFWLGPGGPSQYVADVLAWMPLTAHNGYLDILNELGAVGLALMAAMMAWHTWQVACLLRIDREAGAIHLALFVLMAINNFSESELLKDVLFQNIFFIYSSLAVSTTLALHRRARLEPGTPPAPARLRSYA